MGNSNRVLTQFGETIRRERERRFWTQGKVAELVRDRGIGCHNTTIAKLEAGERPARIDEIVALADVFEVSLDVLLDRKVSKVNDADFALRQLFDDAERALPYVEVAHSFLSNASRNLVALNPPNRRRFTDALALIGTATRAMTEAINALVKLQKTEGYERFMER